MTPIVVGVRVIDQSISSIVFHRWSPDRTDRNGLIRSDPRRVLAHVVDERGSAFDVELGYVFESIGTDVTIVEMMDSLVPREDGDVSAAFTDVASDRTRLDSTEPT